MKKVTLFLSIAITLLLILDSCKENNYAEGYLSQDISIYDIKKIFKGEEVLLTEANMNGASFIRGVVVSDTEAGNIIPGTVVLQGYKSGRTRGIILDFSTENSNLNIGDSIRVNVINAVLKNVNGSLFISGLTPSNITKISSGNVITPIELTAAQLKAKPNEYEATLVKIFSNVYTADVQDGEKFVGGKIFNDGNENIILFTSSTAAFAQKKLAASATFVGIPLFYNATPDISDLPLRLWLRNEVDIMDASGPLYANFPESFESGTKTNTAAEDVIFNSGTWLLNEAVLGTNKPYDKMNPSGLQSVRFSKDLSVPALLQMRFDVPEGASKITFLYASTANEVPCTFKLEYSIDQGASWLQMGNDIFCDNKILKTATFTMDIKSPVRFRIYKYGLGKSTVNINNERFNLDDFAIYKGLN